MSTRTRGVVACTALLVASPGLAGCGEPGPVRIDAPTLSGPDARACRELVADLPDTMAGHERREVSGDTAYGAAWGDPAIVLTCGVGVPAGFNDTSTCVQVGEAGWYVPDEVLGKAVDQNDTSVDVPTTEMNFRPRLRVVVPGEYRPDGFTNTIGALTRLVERDLRRVGRCH